MNVHSPIWAAVVERQGPNVDKKQLTERQAQVVEAALRLIAIRGSRRDLGSDSERLLDEVWFGLEKTLRHASGRAKPTTRTAQSLRRGAEE
jgi:hypothetical protein